MNNFFHVFPRILFFLLADFRILGSIRECDEPFKKFNLIIKKGFFYNIFVFTPSFGNFGENHY